MSGQYWLVKSEPETYGWDQFVREKGTAWTGVRNFQARNFLKAMKKGDSVFFYHSGDGKCVVGVACVKQEAYPDPTTSEEGWVCVDLEPVKPLKKSVDLVTIKKDSKLKDLYLIRQSRLSVMPLEKSEFDRILELGGMKT
jgi:predicted RNA-binding protein with PUA-like domain